MCDIMSLIEIIVQYLNTTKEVAMMPNEAAMIDVMKLAEHVIWYADANKQPITHLKLQKILYYLQGEFLKRYHKPLFDAEIQAWPYGPVVPDVYYQLCSNGALPLYSDAKSTDDKADLRELDADENNTIRSKLNELLPQTARQLVTKTHQEKPWLKHKGEVDQGEKPVITMEEMRAFLRRSKL